MSLRRRLSDPLPLPPQSGVKWPDNGVWETNHPPRNSRPWNERVVHFHCALPNDMQPSLPRVVRTLATSPSNYRLIDWRALGIVNARAALLDAARELRPTLVFMQVQRMHILEEEHFAELRKYLDKDAVVVWWCGDVANQNGLAAWPLWMPQLLPYIDLALYSNVTVPRAMQAAGFEQAGYLQVGFDEEYFYPRSRDATVVDYSDYDYDLVFFARRYLRKQGLDELAVETDEALRHAAMKHFYRVPGIRYLWSKATPSVDTGAIYRRSRAALSISVTHRYDRMSSDRLFRILASGCVPIVRRFVGDAALGLAPEKNCLAFSTLAEAESHAKYLAKAPASSMKIWSENAVRLAQEHTWEKRMEELAPLVDFVREHRV